MAAATRISPRDTKRLRDFLARFVDGTEGFKNDEAEYLLGAISQRPRRGPAKSLRLPGKTKANKRADRQARMSTLAEIRVGLYEESRGLCAVCSWPVVFVLMHAHHILSGPERQVEERQGTMAPVHDRCHDSLHGKDTKLDQREALVALLGYCVMTKKDPLAIASIERRINKIDEARSSAGRQP